MTTGKSRQDSAWVGVWLLVLLIHAAWGWLLSRGMQIELDPGNGNHGNQRALQVTFIQPRIQRQLLREEPAPAPRLARALPDGAVQPRPSPPRTRTPATTPTPPAPSPARPLTTVYLAQARDWARQQAEREAPLPSGFADPAAPLPTTPGRFRMRARHSPADLVAAVGGYLFAPAGYEADPCPQNRRNIAALATGGDRAALQHELEFEHRHCR